MRMYDLILKKREGGALSEDEIRYLITNYVSGEIPDYQMAAFLMAVYYKGMTEEETSVMTDAVAHSGDMVDLSSIPGIKVDKHSTGGVGDKTTLIVTPMVAACGVKVAKMSGRGLGHTGGTVDKLESIPGLKTDLTQEEFFQVVNKTGISVIGQSGNLTPADKMMYALRDVTATVDSIPLIAVSIMSKKLAAGSDCILLDVKTGSGAFMKTVPDAIALAEEMVKIGESRGRRTVALVTNMDIPLGNYIGNSLEVTEAVATLNGNGPEDLTEECINLAANMLYLAGKGATDSEGNVLNDENQRLARCRELARQTITDGSALKCLIAMVEAQGGDSEVIKDTNKFTKAQYNKPIYAKVSGYIGSMDTEQCGVASSLLGAGRMTKDSPIDYAAGLILHKKTGDRVEVGDVLATMYTDEEAFFQASEKTYQEAITIQKEKPEPEPLVYARVTKDGVERFS